MTRFVLALAFLLATPAAPLSDDIPTLTLRIVPAHQFEPGTVSYRISIPPHRDNFWFCMGWTNETIFKSRTSCQSLNGIYSPRVFYQEYRDLGPGHYRGFVDVYRTPNYRAETATQAFVVIDH